jgi:hypothetical protein
MENYNIILIIFVISIILNAVADGFRLKDIESPSKINGDWYHYFWAFTILSLLSLLLVKIELSFFLKYIIAYALLRFGLFDFVLNYTARKNALYIGKTSSIDRLMRKIFNTPGRLSFMAFVRAVSFIAGMMLIQYFN